MYQNLPHNIAIIHCVATLLSGCESILNPTTEEHKVWVEAVNAGNLNDNSDIRDNPLYVRMVQAILLGSISMYGGIFVPAIKHFSLDGAMLKLTWDSRISDSFTIGVWDKDFDSFIAYFKTRCSFEGTANALVNQGTLLECRKLIESYMIILNAVFVRLNKVSDSKAELVNLISGEIDRDLMFILCSCLPTDQINAMFIYIQQYFPDELEVEKRTGSRVNVCQFFQTSSTDINYLIEKIHIYLNLYFSDSHPVIKEITSLKTSAYMKQIVQNDDSFQSTMQALESLKTQQIMSRNMLYKTIKYALDPL